MPPLHPVLPALVEVYVNSILVPSPKAPQEHTNRPMSEDEIRSVFQNSVFGAQFDGKKQRSGLAMAVMSSEEKDTGNASKISWEIHHVTSRQP